MKDHPSAAARDRRQSRLGAALLAVAAVAAALAAAFAHPAPPPKKLLQWGWDEPDTAFLRAHLPEMEESPFDGCVFGVRSGPGGRGGSFSWQFWGRRRFSENELASAFSDLRALRPRRFTELFLRVNVTPGDVGWFQDCSAIVANARLAARLARAAHARGILLDTEQYQGQLFDFRRQPMAAGYGWEAYAEQARRRGRAVMQAFQEGYPGLTVFLTFAQSLPWVQMTATQGGSPALSYRPNNEPDRRRQAPKPSTFRAAASIAQTRDETGAAVPPGAHRPLAKVPYGLLAPFVAGLLDGARGRTVVVDGFELSYGYKTYAQFAEARRLVLEDTPAIAGGHECHRRLRLSFGLWLDYDWRQRGWDPVHLTQNYFSPPALGQALDAALVHADEYVWLYTETARRWGRTSEGIPGYDAELRAAELRSRLRSSRGTATPISVP